jgi:hypothetical protein
VRLNDKHRKACSGRSSSLAKNCIQFFQDLLLQLCSMVEMDDMSGPNICGFFDLQDRAALVYMPDQVKFVTQLEYSALGILFRRTSPDRPRRVKQEEPHERRLAQVQPSRTSQVERRWEKSPQTNSGQFIIGCRKQSPANRSSTSIFASFQCDT